LYYNIVDYVIDIQKISTII